MSKGAVNVFIINVKHDFALNIGYVRVYLILVLKVYTLFFGVIFKLFAVILRSRLRRL